MELFKSKLKSLANRVNKEKEKKRKEREIVNVNVLLIEVIFTDEM